MEPKSIYDKIEQKIGREIPRSRPGADYSFLTDAKNKEEEFLDYGEIPKTADSVRSANAFREGYIGETKEMMKEAGDSGRGPGTRQAQIYDRFGGF